MVKTIGLLLLVFVSFSAAAASEFEDEVRKLGKEIEKKAREKASRQKSSAEEQLKLLSMFGNNAGSDSSSEFEAAKALAEKLAAEEAEKKAAEAEPQPDNDTPTTEAEKPTGEDKDKAPAAEAELEGDVNTDQESGNETDHKPSTEIDKSKSDQTKQPLSEEDKEKTEPEPKFKNNTLLEEEGVYIPPLVSFSQRNQSSFAANVKQENDFGISFGTWFEAEITREVTSGDNAEIELILSKDVVGKHKTLPKGTIIYANKSF